jgi:hypothetical protein
MENKWLLYEKTLQNIYNNQKIFMNMLIYYYKLVIINKENNKEYIKENYPKQNISDLDIFNEYIIDTKNLGIFTIFNNIPDVIHPLENDYYYNYGMYLSFIDPKYFKKSEKDDILILDTNIWKYSKYYFPIVHQDIAPYNNYKKYIYLNIRYFNREKYKNYLIITVNDNKEIYIFDNNIIKKKVKKEWKIIEEKEISNSKLIYTCILRKILKDDIFNVFNENKIIKKDTLLYSYHSKDWNKPSIIDFFTTNKNNFLKDPFKVWYKKGDELNKFIFKLTEDISIINLTCDILSNNKLSKTKSIDILINNNKLNSNNIYNGNLNYIYDKKISENIFFENVGKRLLLEIILKTSNFNIAKNISYKKFLKLYNINNFLYSYGYYNKLNKFYDYEYYINNREQIQFIKLEKIILDDSY